jgi:hypothetical protein
MRALADWMNAITMEDGILWGLVLGVVIGTALGDGVWIALGLALGIGIGLCARPRKELAQK